MPIYRYKCENCKYELELIQSIKEGNDYLASEPNCPECEGGKLGRIISLGSFQLNGRGWFKDGY